MMSNFFTKTIRLHLVASITLLAYSGLAPADDTEIYQNTPDAASTGRPKVLIVFDDSGSMTSGVANQKPAYNSSTTYSGVHTSGRVYYSTDGKVPDDGSSTWFPVDKNYCAESLPGLNSKGFFATKSAFQWRLSNEKWRWRDLKAAKTDLVVDCWEDLANSNDDNLSAADGYPKQKSISIDVSATPPPKYVTAIPGTGNGIWKRTQVYNFYSANYMNWKYATLPLVTRTRMDIAQEVVTSLVFANRGLDFGLMEFNRNSSGKTWHGGRIVQRIIADMSIADRNNMIDIVGRFQGAGNTPLCESTYEAYRYIKGGDVKWGHSQAPGGQPQDFEPYDPNAEITAGGTYKSPASDCAYTYIIIMTDGAPTADTAANDLIETLTGNTCLKHGSGTKNCMPELAEYMANNDLDGDSSNGDQFGITYTIGFTTDQTLLSKTAELGKGEYYTADSAEGLTEAFAGAILSILASDSSFTSPAVAVDTFTRTRSRNDVFYAMFKPSEEIDWIGNIKKLKLSITDADSDGDFDAVLVDSLGVPAIDAATGDFKASISTFWSSGDGGAVEAGGVGALLAARDPALRTIKSNTGTSGALENYESANMTRDAFGFSTDVTLFDFFGVDDQDGLDAELAYGRGFEINNDGSISAVTREWILADILHSQPVVINYGARTGFTATNPDLRIVVGTNGGFLHMFGDNDGQEDWAFFPKELAPVLRQRRLNPLSADHVYGVDALPVIYTKDNNQNGTIDSGDKVWAFFGLRRGGRGMYALDISDPDSPTYLWGIDSNSTGFSELGQTWSVPVVTRIPGYADGDGVPKPVIIFGAGYDVNKDDTGVATTDSMGRGLYIVDAATGALVWSVTPDSNSATNMQETGLLHSVAGQVSTVDSNGDELTDRIYFSSTGGNVWRVDMGVNTLPTISQNTWFITQLADFNGGGTATDRRFFYAPDVVRIRKNGAPVDAVLIGSGDRTNPNATDVDNRFYVISDEAIMSYTTAPPSSSDCTATPPSTDFRCKLPLDDADLFDITDNILITGTTSEKTIALAALSAANGLHLDLTQSGEKVTAKSFTINGRAFFPTFTPDDGLSTINVCKPEAGQGLLYIFDIYKGDRDTINLGPILPDSPSVHFGEDGKIRLLLPPGSPPDGDGDPDDVCANGVCDIGEAFRAPYGNYWFQEEY